MKTLPVLTFVAALVAFVTLPLNLETTIALLFVAGMAPLIFSDYARQARPLRMQATVVAGGTSRTERLGLAA